MSQEMPENERSKRNDNLVAADAVSEQLNLDSSLSEAGKPAKGIASRELLVAVYAHQAALFVDSGESLLTLIARLTERGIWDEEFVRLRNARIAEFGPLGNQVRSLTEKADLLLTELERITRHGDRETIGETVEQILHPLLRDFESAVDRIYELDTQVVEDWRACHDTYSAAHVIPPEEEDVDGEPDIFFDLYNPVDNARLFIDGHRDLYDCIKKGLHEYQFDPELKTQPTNSNELLLELALGCAVDPEFSDSPSLIEMNPDHLRFICTLISRELVHVGDAVHQNVIRDSFASNAFCELSEDQLSITDALPRVEHSFFGSKRVKAYTASGDTFVLEYAAPSCLQRDWKDALHDLHQRLTLATDIVDLYFGSVDTQLAADEEVVRVALTLPMITEQGSDTKALCEAEMNKRSLFHSWDDEPAMTSVEFSREVRQESGDIKIYTVDTAGAALLSEEARTTLRHSLAQADQYMRIIPELDTVTLDATGTAQSITESFKTGDIRILLTGDTQKNRPIHRSYSFVHGAFSWEDQAETPAQPIPSEPDLSYRGIAFTPSTFSDDFVQKKIADLHQRADLLQIPCEHDQEMDYVCGAAQTNLMIRGMLTDLVRVLDELQASEEHSRLKIQVIQCSNLLIAEIGTTDTLYKLNVFDERAQLIARGEFSRQKQNWKIRLVNLHEEAKVAALVAQVIEGIIQESIGLRTLNVAFHKAGIELPEELAMSLLEALRGDSHHEYLPPASPRQVIENFLKDIHTTIQIDENKVVISKEQEIAPITSSYGVIVDFSGLNPQEVANYQVAKKLYEDPNYDSFQPNRIFLVRYRNEQEHQEN
jgi:hypothetical protein